VSITTENVTPILVNYLAKMSPPETKERRREKRVQKWGIAVAMPLPILLVAFFVKGRSYLLA